MKIRTPALLLSLLMLVGCAASGPDLVGSWRLVAPERTDGCGTFEAIKNVTDTHFAFGHQTWEGPFSGGGTWEMDGDSYVEHVEWHSLDVLVGESITFTCRVEGDLWYHAADCTVDGERFRIDEVWERVKPGKTCAERVERH